MSQSINAEPIPRFSLHPSRRADDVIARRGEEGGEKDRKDRRCSTDRSTLPKPLAPAIWIAQNPLSGQFGSAFRFSLPYCDQGNTEPLIRARLSVPKPPRVPFPHHHHPYLDSRNHHGTHDLPLLPDPRAMKLTFRYVSMLPNCRVVERYELKSQLILLAEV